MLDLDKMIQVAMKQHKKAQVNAFRNLKTKIVNAKTSPLIKEYNDQTEISIISKYVKDLKYDSECYFAADRDDLGKEYYEEAEILSCLIPKEPTEEEIVNSIYDFIEANIGPLPETKTIDKKMMGSCIKFVKEKYPTSDGKTVSKIVKEFVP